MKRLIVSLLVGMTLIMCVAFSPASAEEMTTMSTESDLDLLVEDLLAWKTRDAVDLRNAWDNGAFKEKFQDLAALHGFVIPKEKLEGTFGWALEYCAIEAYGDEWNFWTLKQRYQWDIIQQRLGLDNDITCALPDENSLTEKEAIELARQIIIDNVGMPQYAIARYGLEDFETCTRVGLSYFDYSNLEGTDEKYWEIKFYRDVSSLIRWPGYINLADWDEIFSVYILIKGEQQITGIANYNDPFAMNAYWSEARRAHNDLPLAMWSLEDKQLLYQTLMSLYEREMARQGHLPETDYIQILAHKQSVPQNDELTENEAVQMAKAQLIAQGVSPVKLDAAQIGVYLWRDEEQESIYHIEFFDGEATLKYSYTEPEKALLYTVEIDARR